MEDFLMLPCDANDDIRGKDERYDTSSKECRKRGVSTTYLMTY